MRVWRCLRDSEGLVLDEKTGQINGIPTDTSDGIPFTVYGENESGAASTIVSIRIRKGQCLEEGIFPTTDAGVVAIYTCSMKGNFVGTQKRECVLGEREGEWQKATGVCVSVVLIILLCVVVFVVVIVIILVRRRPSKTLKKLPKKNPKSSKV